jgi:hypothetical protein
MLSIPLGLHQTTERMYLLMSGCTANNRKALKKIVAA